MVSRGSTPTPRPSRQRTGTSVGVVESHVPDRRRLFLDAGIPAGHRVFGRRSDLTAGDTGPRSPHAVWRFAHVLAGCRTEPAWAGQHRNPRETAAAMARQGTSPLSPWIRGNGLHHHHHD